MTGAAAHSLMAAPPLPRLRLSPDLRRRANASALPPSSLRRPPRRAAPLRRASSSPARAPPGPAFLPFAGVAAAGVLLAGNAAAGRARPVLIVDARLRSGLGCSGVCEAVGASLASACEGVCCARGSITTAAGAGCAC
jgi:hypothetical protein